MCQITLVLKKNQIKSAVRDLVASFIELFKPKILNGAKSEILNFIYIDGIEKRCHNKPQK